MKSLIATISLVLSFLLVSIPPAFATDYHIGPDQTYASIASFTGWTSLQPGDHVYIHPGTYKELLLLCQSGTEANPIVIEGVPDASGNLPILDGDDAITPLQFNGHLPSTNYQGYGVIYIHRSYHDDPFGTEPNWITIKNLDIKSGYAGYNFTDSEGVIRSHPNGSANIYIKTGGHILIDGCIIRDGGDGIEVQGVEAMANDITIRSCHIYGNGSAMPDRGSKEHNLYIESSGLTVEYNVFGPLRNGSSGSPIKSRGSNDVIRYNIIYSGSRVLDLVEPENQASYYCDGTDYRAGRMHEEPGFGETWVYGNVFINGPTGNYPTSGNMIHYGADNCPAISRSGTLYFYNNTFYIDLYADTNYYSRVFDLSTNRETLDARNNVFISAGTTRLYMGNLSGTYNWNGGNYVFTNSYYKLRPNSAGTWNENVPILRGTDSTVALTDPANGDFSIKAGSPLINSGLSLPTTITDYHPVNIQYAAPHTYITRADTDDIGAFMYGASGAVPTCSDGIQNGDETGVDCGGSCGACTSQPILPPFVHPANTN